MEHAAVKITSQHLAKKAILYIRQSTLRQVYENTESTLRQYALKERLYALGWRQDDIIVIDQDLGHSGAEAENREGFQRLVSEVTNGKAGAIACIECSRLSRSSSDWGRLTEYCAMTNTVLIDADGIYDPNDFNDRLLLGLKGTLSEAELHFLKERMRGGLMNKAKRGELKKPLPIGYIYNDIDHIVKDPAADIRQAVELLFDSYRNIGSAWGLLAYYKRYGYRFPHRVRKGSHKNDIVWLELQHSTVLRMLHNPMYAGVYHYGEDQTVWTPEGKKRQMVPKEKWHVFIKNHHDAYITYEEFEFNEKQLLSYAHPRSEEGRKSPPREGPALLQGLALCGKCGKRMTVHYSHNKKDSLTPYYVCQRESVEKGGNPCQSIHGQFIDEKVSEVMLRRLTPLAVQESVRVQQELCKRKAEMLTYYKLRVDKCEYEANLARRRYMQVDPDYRLVALELESAWNVCLKELEEATEEYEKKVKDLEQQDTDAIDSMDNLCDSLSSAWNAPGADDKDKKRMMRYLIEDVTLLKDADGVQAHIRYKGMTTESILIELPQRASQKWKTDAAIVDFIREESKKHTPGEIADLLNQQGLKTGKNNSFHIRIVQRLIRVYKIPTLRQHYLDKGYITCAEKASALGIAQNYLARLVDNGSYSDIAVRVNDKSEYLFER